MQFLLQRVVNSMRIIIVIDWAIIATSAERSLRYAALQLQLIRVNSP